MATRWQTSTIRLEDRDAGAVAVVAVRLGISPGAAARQLLRVGLAAVARDPGAIFDTVEDEPPAASAVPASHGLPVGTRTRGA